MAISEHREVVIEASPDEILAVLFDVEKLTDWSSAHQEVEVLERDDDGIGWTLVSSKQQRAQEARYTLTPEGDATRVHFDLTVDLSAPLPGFLIRKGAKGLLDTATDGLRKRVMKVKG